MVISVSNCLNFIYSFEMQILILKSFNLLYVIFINGNGFIAIIADCYLYEIMAKVIVKF